MRMNVLRNRLCNLVDLRDFGFGGGLKGKYHENLLSFQNLKMF